MNEEITDKDFKILAYEQRISELTVEYERKIADLRIELTRGQMRMQEMAQEMMESQQASTEPTEEVND